jgi:uncharacterized protein YigA (DUF484 family)
MQMENVKQQLPRIDALARNAAQLCQNANATDELSRCVDELEREAGVAASMVTVEQDERRIVDCVDRLEALGDRALDACRRESGIDERVQRAVQGVHDSVRDLKRSMH